MAEQILSQVEVDALLRGLSNGDIKTEAEKKEESHEGVRAYDFYNHEKSIRGRMPTLEMLNEKFSRAIRGPIFNVLRKSVDISPEGVKTMKYDEFLKNLQVPSSLNVFQLAPLRGQGVLAIDPNLVFLIVDSYFGGDGRFHTRVEGKDFTSVEQAVVKKVVDVVFGEMKDVWKPVHQIEFKYLRSEMNPQFINIVAQHEPVIVSTFRMELESASNRFFICLPYSTVEPIKEKLYGIQQVNLNETDKRWAQSLRDQFGGVPLDVSTEIGSARINVAEMLNLKVGDVIQLDRKAREPLEVNIEGIPKYYAKPGVRDNNYALEILGAINDVKTEENA